MYIEYIPQRNTEKVDRQKEDRQMMKIYASENRQRAIKVNEDREIVAAYGLKNVLCCEADGESGIIAMEELVEIDPATEFDWSEIA